MKAAHVLLVWAAASVTPGSLFGYAAYFSDNLTSLNATNWAVNGSPSGTSAGLYASGQGSVVSEVAVPDGSAN